MNSVALPALQVVDSYFPEHPKPAPLPHPQPTESFWLYSGPDCNPLADVGSDAPLPPEVDICIVGSGISGVSTLYHLIQGLQRSARSVTRIAVLEARQFCGGATGRNGDELQISALRHLTAYNPLAFAEDERKYGTKDAIAHVELERRTVDFLVGLAKQNGWEDDIDLQQGGNIHLINSEEEREVLAQQLKAAEAAGVDTSSFKWLSREECSEKIHSRSHLSGLEIPGNNLYPLRLVTKIFQLAQREAAEIGIDVQLFTHTPVDRIVQKAGRDGASPLWEAQTKRGCIDAGVVVHATNAYASHLLPQLSTGSKRVIPCRGQVVAVRPTQPEQFWTTGFSYNEGFEYFFQRPATEKPGARGRPYVILGGGRSVAPKPYELDVADDSALQPDVERYLEAFLPHHFPKLFAPADKMAIDFKWTGIMGFTESRNPYVGRVIDDGGEQKGQYLLAGFSGHGMSRSSACAEYVASLILADLSGTETPECSWMPSHFLLSA